MTQTAPIYANLRLYQLHLQTLINFALIISPNTHDPQAAIRNKKGLHKKREADEKLGDSFHVNDISHPGNANKAKQHLAFLTRNKATAVVEAVLSGNRLKVGRGFSGSLFS